MIRNPVKIGVVSASNSGVETLAVPTGHNGTISHFAMLCYSGASLVDPASAIASITLEATHQNEGNFAILDKVTTKLLEYRERRLELASENAAQTGASPSTGILTYNPAAGLYKDEVTRNIQTLGCQDLTDMNFRDYWLFGTLRPRIDFLENSASV